MDITPPHEEQLAFSNEALNKNFDLVEHWLGEFMQSEEIASLPDSAQAMAANVVMYFAEYMFTHSQQAPQHWSAEALIEVCTEVMPAKIAADAAFYEAITPVLHAFLVFCQQQDLLPQGQLLAAQLPSLQARILANAANEAQWSMSKVIAMMALKAGVDLEDEDQVRHFMQMVNTTYEQQAWSQVDADSSNKE